MTSLSVFRQPNGHMTDDQYEEFYYDDEVEYCYDDEEYYTSDEKKLWGQLIFT